MLSNLAELKWVHRKAFYRFIYLKSDTVGDGLLRGKKKRIFFFSFLPETEDVIIMLYEDNVSPEKLTLKEK